MEHLGLLIQRGQVGGAGDVAAQHLILRGVQLQRHAVVGDGGAQNGDVGGSGSGGGEGGGGVGQDQIHLLGHEAVDDGAAVGHLTAGVLLPDLHLVAQSLLQSVNKPLCSRVQRGMGRQLADADHILILGLGGSSAAAGGQRQHQGPGKAQSQ